MSAQILNAFEKKYSDDVTHLAAQMQSKLMGQTRLHRNVVGSTYDFRRMAGITAATRASGSSAEVTGLDPVTSVVTATLADFEVPIYAQKFDQYKTSVDQLKEYQVETVAAINRKIDDTIIAAAAAATTTTATVAGGLTYAKLLEIVTFFNSNDVDSEDRILVLSPACISDALGITQLTSSDYVQVQGVMSAGIGNVLGMKWIMSSRLPFSTTRTNFAFNKKAIGVAMGQDLSTEINYIPQRVSTLINTTVSLGAVVIDNLQIVKMTTVA